MAILFSGYALDKETLFEKLQPSEKKNTGYVEIADNSDLPLLNPDFASQTVSKLRLDNGVELLLISDPRVEVAAASVVVDVGSWNDPEEFPGMAHFCEHMLFMGTAKYPNENEFLAAVADQGGITNAMTAADRTVYMFSAHNEGLFPLLDRFAHFFIDPLFKPSNIAREMHAVDQEFAKNIEHDGWRLMMVLKETGNQDHPNQKFSCGNSTTLSQIPQKALIQWHRAHYTADKIHVVIYAPQSMESLKEQAVRAFQQVPVSVEEKAPLHLPSILSARQKGHCIYIQPIQNKQSLTMLWELPETLSEDSTHAADLVAYAIERGQEHSLYEKLKAEQLIESLSVNVEDIGGKKHRLFEVNIELTEEGVKQVDTVILRVFQTVALLRSTGVPNYLFYEQNQIAKLKYQYQSRRDPFQHVMQLAWTLPDEPLATYPRTQVIASAYAPDKISEVLQLLTPDGCALFFLTPRADSVSFDYQEKWLGVSYGIRSLSAGQLQKWSQAQVQNDIRLPEPNPFVPTRLDCVTETGSETPTLISRDTVGTAYYARCPEFKNPEASLFVQILSPEITENARSQVLSSLYCAYLEDLLHPLLSAAEQAGLSTALSTQRSRIQMRISGFSEKAHLLLQQILQKMTLNQPPTTEKFAMLRAPLEKEYQNMQKELAFFQAKNVLDALLHKDHATPEAKLTVLQALHYDDFLSFYHKVLKKTYVEALFAGNLTTKEAESAWLDVAHLLGSVPYPKAEHIQPKVAQIPAGPYSISKTTPMQGNATLLLVDEGTFTHPKRAAQEILSLVLKEAFFSELRTKQKTGYIALSDSNESEERLFQLFAVQSNSHQPEELLHRFELFIEDFLENLTSKISQERFVTLKDSAASALKNRFCNLTAKSSLWNTLAFQYHADFTFFQKRLQAIETLSYPEFTKISQAFLERANKHRLAILFEGKLADSFAYEPTTTDAFAEIAIYAPRTPPAEGV